MFTLQALHVAGTFSDANSRVVAWLCIVFMDNKKREYVHSRHQAIHADVEALASHVEQLLSSFGVSSEEAVKVYGEIIATGDTLLAAYTAAINVAEEALQKSATAAEEVQELTKALNRSKSLAILPDHHYK